MAISDDDNAGVYYLVSFAPTTGVGFYELDGCLWRFDIVSEDETAMKRIFPKDGREQIKVGQYCTREELLGFAQKAYLGEKKNTYYASLFTKVLPAAMRSKILRFLNESKMAGVTVSRPVLLALNDFAEPPLVAAVLAQAREMGLDHVQRCLVTEFKELTLCPRVLAALRTPVMHQGAEVIRHYRQLRDRSAGRRVKPDRSTPEISGSRPSRKTNSVATPEGQ